MKIANDIIFRQAWNNTISDFISTVQNGKPIIFCGDFNVCNETIDVVDMKSKINKYPGCFDIEREQFKELLSKCNLIDTFRHLNPETPKVYILVKLFKTTTQ